MIHVLVTVTQQVTDQELDADDSPEIAGSYVVQVKEGSTDPTNVPADASWI